MLIPKLKDVNCTYTSSQPEEVLLIYSFQKKKEPPICPRGDLYFSRETEGGFLSQEEKTGVRIQALIFETQWSWSRHSMRFKPNAGRRFDLQRDNQ